MAGPTDQEIAAKRYTAKQFLDTIDAAAEWRRHLGSEDPNVALRCWTYLNDRVYGKPAQAVDMKLGGELNLAECIKRARERGGRDQKNITSIEKAVVKALSRGNMTMVLLLRELRAR